MTSKFNRPIVCPVLLGREPALDNLRLLANESAGPDANATDAYRLILPGQRSGGEPLPVPAETPPFPGTTPTISVPTGLTSCQVITVVDGDTIDVADCADAGRVRLILIDTPEVLGGTECLGKEASAYTTAALEGRTVALERDVSDRGPVRMLRMGGNIALVRCGASAPLLRCRYSRW